MTHLKNYIARAKKDQVPLSKEERDVCLIESLNRYIDTLEHRAAYQDELAAEQRKTIAEQRETIRELEGLLIGLDAEGKLGGGRS
jgi:hypothetical protein